MLACGPFASVPRRPGRLVPSRCSLNAASLSPHAFPPSVASLSLDSSRQPHHSVFCDPRYHFLPAGSVGGTNESNECQRLAQRRARTGRIHWCQLCRGRGHTGTVPREPLIGGAAHRHVADFGATRVSCFSKGTESKARVLEMGT